jgi:hypothetical protein
MQVRSANRQQTIRRIPVVLRFTELVCETVNNSKVDVPELHAVELYVV